MENLEDINNQTNAPELLLHLNFPLLFCHTLPIPGYAEPRNWNLTETKLIFLSLFLINPENNGVRYKIVF